MNDTKIKGVEEGPVAPSVFKTVERRLASLVGSTPMHSRQFLALVALFCTILLGACGDDAMTAKPTPEAPSFVDYANAKSLYSDDVAKPEVLELGEQNFAEPLYSMACAACHATAKGEVRMLAPNLSNILPTYAERFGGKANAKAWLHNKILHADKIKGVNANGWSQVMPVFDGHLRDEDVEAIVEWLASLK